MKGRFVQIIHSKLFSSTWTWRPFWKIAANFFSNIFFRSYTTTFYNSPCRVNLFCLLGILPFPETQEESIWSTVDEKHTRKNLSPTGDRTRASRITNRHYTIELRACQQLKDCESDYLLFCSMTIIIIKIITLLNLTLLLILFSFTLRWAPPITTFFLFSVLSLLYNLWTHCRNGTSGIMICSVRRHKAGLFRFPVEWLLFHDQEPLCMCSERYRGNYLCDGGAHSTYFLYS